MSEALHRSLVRVRWGDLDRLGHVNNVVYLGYLAEARLELLETLLPANEMTHLAREYEVRSSQVRYIDAVDAPRLDLDVTIQVVDLSDHGFALEYVVADPGHPGRTFLQAREDLKPVAAGRVLRPEEHEALRLLSAGAAHASHSSVPLGAGPPVARRSVPLRFSDLDGFGRVGSHVALEFVQEARYAYLKHLSAEHPGLRDGVALVVAHAAIEHLAPLSGDATDVEVVTSIAHVGRKSVVLDSELSDGSVVVARARVVSVAVDHDLRGAVALPQRLRDVLIAQRRRAEEPARG